jgi:2-amino-4-hydroxy-6-hydroxymethyldihydropteridine diphosphokinase
VRASLADQPSLAIALGANLPSPAGPPLATLLAVRPLLEELLQGLDAAGHAPGHGRLRWSPLFRTAPVGGPPGQPDYLNAAVLVRPARPANPGSALELLAALQGLERRFARQRLDHWGPRSLDLDLLWWGALHCSSKALELPHPRLQERAFVLAPLAAIEAGLVLPAGQATVSERLAHVQDSSADPAPERLGGRPGWPE